MKKHLLAGITLLPALVIAIILGYTNWSYLWTFGVWFICFPLYVLVHPGLWLSVIPFPGLFLLIFNFSNFWPLVLFSIIAGSVSIRLIWYSPIILYAHATDEQESNSRFFKAFLLSLIWIVASYLMIAGTYFTITKSIHALREQNYTIWSVMIPSDIQKADAEEKLTNDRIYQSQQDFTALTDYDDVFTSLVSLQELQKKKIDFTNNTQIRDRTNEIESLLKMINKSVQKKSNVLAELGSAIEEFSNQTSLSNLEKDVFLKQLEIVKFIKTYNSTLSSFTNSFQEIVVFSDEVGFNNELSEEQKDREEKLMTLLVDASHKEFTTRSELNKKLMEYNQLLSDYRNKSN